MLSEKSRIQITIAGFTSILIGAITGTWFIATKVDGFKNDIGTFQTQTLGKIERVQTSIDDLNGRVWRVEDQVEFSHKLETQNSKLNLSVPDTRGVIRKRVSSVHNEEYLSAESAGVINPR